MCVSPKNASKGKGHYRDVIMVNKDVDYYCNKIKESLDNETFKTSKYKVVNKRCGSKVREIHKLPYYPDRIVHHAIMQVVEPIWEKTLIDDTYSCIKGRGIHAGVRRIKSKLKSGINLNKRLASYNGWLKHCNSYNLRLKYGLIK